MRTMLRLLTIKQKIVISYIVILAISLMMVFASVSTIRGNSETAVNQMDFLQQRYDRTRRVMDATYAFHVQVRKMAIEGGYNFDALGSNIGSMITELSTSADALQTARYPNEIGAIKDNVKNYVTLFETQFVPLMKQGKADEARQVALGPMTSSFVIICQNMTKVNGYQLVGTKSQFLEISDATKITIMISVFALIQIAIAMFMGWEVPYVLVTQIKHIAKNAKKLAEGDLTHEMFVERKDEFNPPVSALENMRKD